VTGKVVREITKEELGLFILEEILLNSKGMEQILTVSLWPMGFTYIGF